MKWLTLLILMVPTFALADGLVVQSTMTYRGNTSTVVDCTLGSTPGYGSVLYYTAYGVDTTWTMNAGPTTDCGDTLVEIASSPVTSANARMRVYAGKTVGGCSVIRSTASASIRSLVYCSEISGLSGDVDCGANNNSNSANLATGNCAVNEKYATFIANGGVTTLMDLTEGAPFSLDNKAKYIFASNIAQKYNTITQETKQATATGTGSSAWLYHVAGFKSLDQHIATVVQSTMAIRGTGTDLSCTFPSNTTAGNTLYFGLVHGGSGWNVTAMSDACGDSFVEAAASPAGFSLSRMRVYTATSKGGCATVTITANGVGPTTSYCVEYSGLDNSNLIECTSSATATSSNLATGNCVTTNANDYLVSMAGQQATATFTQGSGYTIQKQATATSTLSGAGEDQKVTSAGTYTGNMTSNATAAWAIHVLAMRLKPPPPVPGLHIYGGKLSIQGMKASVQ